jgi:hypothetical protein
MFRWPVDAARRHSQDYFYLQIIVSTQAPEFLMSGIPNVYLRTPAKLHPNASPIPINIKIKLIRTK